MTSRPPNAGASPTSHRKPFDVVSYKVQNERFEKKREEAQRLTFDFQRAATVHAKTNSHKTTIADEHNGTADGDLNEKIDSFVEYEKKVKGDRKHLGMMLALARLYHAPLGQVLKHSRDTKAQSDDVIKMELDGRMLRLIQLAKEHAHPVEKFDPSQTSNTIIVKNGKIREPTEEEMEEGTLNASKGLLRKTQQDEIDEVKQKARKAKEVAAKLQSQISAIRKIHSDSKTMSQTLTCLNHFTTRFGGSVLKVDLILPDIGIIFSISSTGILEFWEHPNLPIEVSHDEAFMTEKKLRRKTFQQAALAVDQEALQPRLVEFQDIDTKKIGFLTSIINLKSTTEIVEISSQLQIEELEKKASTSSLNNNPETNQPAAQPDKVTRYRGLYLLGSEKGFSQILEVFCDYSSLSGVKTCVRVSGAVKSSHSPVLHTAYLPQDDFVYVFGTEKNDAHQVSIYRLFMPPTETFSPIPAMPPSVLSWSMRPMSCFGLSEIGRFDLNDMYESFNSYEQREDKKSEKRDAEKKPTLRIKMPSYHVDRAKDAIIITCVKADEVAENIQVAVSFTSFPEMAAMFRINYVPLDSIENALGEKIPDRASKNRKFEVYTVFKLVSHDFTEFFEEYGSIKAAREKLTESMLPFKILDLKRTVNFQTHRPEAIVACSDSTIRIISTYVATIGIEQLRYHQPNITSFNLIDYVCYSENAQLLVTFDQDAPTLTRIADIRLLLGFQTDAKPDSYQANDIYRPIPQPCSEFISTPTRISVLSKVHHLVVVTRGSDWTLLHFEKTKSRMEDKINERLGFRRQTLKLEAQYLGAG